MSDKCCHVTAGGGAILCSFTDVFDVRFEGWRFDFSEMFGPLLLNRRTGEPLKRQPYGERNSDRHPFWPAFERWYATYKNRPVESGNAVVVQDTSLVDERA